MAVINGVDISNEVIPKSVTFPIEASLAKKLLSTKQAKNIIYISILCLFWMRFGKDSRLDVFICVKLQTGSSRNCWQLKNYPAAEAIIYDRAVTGENPSMLYGFMSAATWIKIITECNAIQKKRNCYFPPEIHYVSVIHRWGIWKMDGLILEKNMFI